MDLPTCSVHVCLCLCVCEREIKLSLCERVCEQVRGREAVRVGEKQK
jgi:hypothetical protein